MIDIWLWSYLGGQVYELKLSTRAYVRLWLKRCQQYKMAHSACILNILTSLLCNARKWQTLTIFIDIYIDISPQAK